VSESVSQSPPPLATSFFREVHRAADLRTPPLCIGLFNDAFLTISALYRRMILNKLQRMSEVTIEVKLSLCLIEHHVVKTCGVSGGTFPRIVNLGTGWR